MIRNRKKDSNKLEIKNRFFISLFAFFTTFCFTFPPVLAQSIPSSADVTRFQNENEKAHHAPTETLSIPSVEKPAMMTQAMPADAGKIKFTLRQIQIKNATAYAIANLSDIWKNDLNTEITLQRAYQIATEITAQYREDGYFLSRAYIPAQDIQQGTLTIAMSEGYISNIRFEGDVPPENIQKHIEKTLLAERPLSLHKLERQTLLLNDLPGMTFRTILKTESEQDSNSITLVIVGKKQPRFINSSLSLDNSGSRYIGPLIANARFSLARGTPQTELELTATPDSDEFRAIALDHVLPVSLDGVKLALNAAYTQGAPGHTLKSNDIQSKSNTLGASLTWDAVRQRAKNFTLSIAFQSQNSATDILNQPLSRDSTRILKLESHFDLYDRFQGATSLNLALSKGLKIAGASKPGDLNLSRAAGRPDFFRLEGSLYRLQNISGSLNGLAGITGQLANAPLLTAQQFGYGGKNFGRAFDTSEITGDQGYAVMLELRYDIRHNPDNMRFQPFAYFDYGKVWDRNTSTSTGESAASTGFGLRLKTEQNIDASFTIAQPLIRRASTPLSGDGHAPRFSFALSYKF